MLGGRWFAERRRTGRYEDTEDAEDMEDVDDTEDMEVARLHVGDVAGPLEVEPVGLVQLGPDEEVQVVNALVFPDEGGRQAQLAVRLGDADHLRARGVSRVSRDTAE